MAVEIRTRDLPLSLTEQMEGYIPADDFVSNGCTCVADRFFGADFRPACHWHDWAYELGGTVQNKHTADVQFFRNLRSCDAPWWLAAIRYYGVRVFGVPHFKWATNEKPGLLRRLSLFITAIVGL